MDFSLQTVANTVFSDAERDFYRVGLLTMAPSGRFLGVKRSADKERFPNTWGVPGGHIEPEETATVAADREFDEETKGKAYGILFLLQHAHEDLTLLTFLGFCEQEFTPLLGDDHTDSRWMFLQDWPEPASPGMISVFQSAETVQFLNEQARNTRTAHRHAARAVR